MCREWLDDKKFPKEVEELQTVLRIQPRLDPLHPLIRSGV